MASIPTGDFLLDLIQQTDPELKADDDAVWKNTHHWVALCLGPQAVEVVVGKLCRSQD